MVAPLVVHLTRVTVESVIIGHMKMLLQDQKIFVIFLLDYKVDGQIEENNETFKLRGDLDINEATQLAFGVQSFKSHLSKVIQWH